MPSISATSVVQTYDWSSECTAILPITIAYCPPSILFLSIDCLHLWKPIRFPFKAVQSSVRFWGRQTHELINCCALSHCPETFLCQILPKLIIDNYLSKELVCHNVPYKGREISCHLLSLICLGLRWQVFKQTDGLIAWSNVYSITVKMVSNLWFI